MQTTGFVFLLIAALLLLLPAPAEGMNFIKQRFGRKKKKGKTPLATAPTAGPPVAVNNGPQLASFAAFTASDRFIAVVNGQAFYLSSGTSNHNAFPLMWFPFCGFGPSTHASWKTTTTCNPSAKSNQELYKCNHDKPKDAHGKEVERHAYWRERCTDMCKAQPKMILCTTGHTSDTFEDHVRTCAKELVDHWVDEEQLLKNARLPFVKRQDGEPSHPVWAEVFQYFQDKHHATQPVMVPWTSDPAKADAWLRDVYLKLMNDMDVDDDEELPPSTLAFPADNEWIVQQGGRVPGWNNIRIACGAK